MSSYLEWKRRALLMGTGGWWVPNNYDPANCVCAYLFKGVTNKAAAQADLTGNGLTLSIASDPDLSELSNGWHLTGHQFLSNATATDSQEIGAVTNSTKIKTAIIRFGKITDGRKGALTSPNTHFALIYDNDNNGLYIHCQFAEKAFVSNEALNGDIVGCNYLPDNEADATTHPIYVNGQKKVLNGVASAVNVNGSCLFHPPYMYAPNTYATDEIVFIAGAFYSYPLNDKQHLEIADRMALLK